jgi:DNA-directed RNA polymerase I subunit RPA2
MLVEIMAGKAGAIHGTKQDATTFTFDEEYPAHHHFGQQLAKAGYNYYGNELLYSVRCHF